MDSLRQIIKAVSAFDDRKLPPSTISLRIKAFILLEPTGARIYSNGFGGKAAVKFLIWRRAIPSIHFTCQLKTVVLRP